MGLFRQRDILRLHRAMGRILAREFKINDVEPLTKSTARQLRDRIEELESLLGLQLPLLNIWQVQIKLNPTDAKILGLLLKHRGRTCSRDYIYFCLYGARPDCDQPQSTIINHYITRIRGRLKPYNIKIHTKYDQGWSLSELNANKLEKVIRQTVA